MRRTSDANHQRIAYVYKAPTEKRGTKVRVIWGRVTRTHGGNGVVRTKFRHNIPPHAFGESVRILLYPSNSMYFPVLHANPSLKRLLYGLRQA